MPSKQVRVHYRHYHRGSAPCVDAALSTAVSAALDHTINGVELDADVRLRTYVDPDYGSVILNGRFRAKNGDVYGELVRFDPETNIPLLMQNSAARDELEVRELVKPNDAEILRGMSFFLLSGDHAIVIEQDLSNSVMERYVRWLLDTQTGLSQNSARVQLIPKLFLTDQLDQMPNVRMIRLKPGRLRADELEFGSDKTTFSSALDIEPTTNVLSILKAAHFDTAVIERLLRDSGSVLEMNLTVTMKTGTKTLKMTGEDAVSLLRNVPEDDLILIGDGVRRNRGVYEHLSAQVSVERRGNILDRKDAWKALSEAARSYRNAGLIE
jgi:hypothetical protein